MEDEINGPSVVFYIEPIAHIKPLAIDRQREFLADIVDEKWDQFFRELVGTVIIGAVAKYNVQSVGIMIGANEMIARGL